jgi:hypothetical protein
MTCWLFTIHKHVIVALEREFLAALVGEGRVDLGREGIVVGLALVAPALVVDGKEGLVVKDQAPGIVGIRRERQVDLEVHVDPIDIAVPLGESVCTSHGLDAGGVAKDGLLVRTQGSGGYPLFRLLDRRLEVGVLGGGAPRVAG